MPGAGKGDSPRPVNGEIFRRNFQKIFRKSQWNSHTLSGESRELVSAGLSKSGITQLVRGRASLSNSKISEQLTFICTPTR
jgi:hypothetical protein